MNQCDHCKVIEELRPFMDGEDNVTESQNDYCSRFRSHFSQFPNDVIAQWFYEHPNSLSQNDWLNYRTLSFGLVKIPIDAVKNECFHDNPFVELYRQYLLQGQLTPRIIRLVRYIKDKGSWPVPPIVLDNFDSKQVFPWGMGCSFPYQLLEGRHRFAVMITLLDAVELLAEHDVWLCRRKLS